jgi:hypothetical protein
MLSRYGQIKNRDKEEHSNPHFRHWRLIHFVQKLTRPFEKDDDVFWTNKIGTVPATFTYTTEKVKYPHENLREHSRSVSWRSKRRIF